MLLLLGGGQKIRDPCSGVLTIQWSHLFRNLQVSSPGSLVVSCPAQVERREAQLILLCQVISTVVWIVSTRFGGVYSSIFDVGTSRGHCYQIFALSVPNKSVIAWGFLPETINPKLPKPLIYRRVNNYCGVPYYDYSILYPKPYSDY